MIESGIFHHIYHIGCAFNLHSMINNGLIPGGQGSSRRQIVFFLPIDPRDKDHKDPEHINFSSLRSLFYQHSVSSVCEGEETKAAQLRHWTRASLLLRQFCHLTHNDRTHGSKNNYCFFLLR